MIAVDGKRVKDILLSVRLEYIIYIYVYVCVSVIKSVHNGGNAARNKPPRRCLKSTQSQTNVHIGSVFCSLAY